MCIYVYWCFIDQSLCIVSMDRNQLLFVLIRLKQYFDRRVALRARRRRLFIMVYDMMYRRTCEEQALQFYLVVSRTLRSSPRYWQTLHHQEWFETLWPIRRHEVVREIWKKQFRVKVETFEAILHLVQGLMTRQHTMFRPAIVNQLMFTKCSFIILFYQKLSITYLKTKNCVFYS